MRIGTDWASTASFYGVLVSLQPRRLVVALSRAMAIREAEGPAHGIREISAMALTTPMSAAANARVKSPLLHDRCLRSARRQIFYFASVRGSRRQGQDVHNNTALYLTGTPPRAATLATQWLVGYQVNPWTVFYAGSSEGYQETTGSQLVPEQRTTFLKASYYLQP